ncbi:MAG: SWIM zinc finger family protein [Byssovorax sp.]
MSGEDPSKQGEGKETEAKPEGDEVKHPRTEVVLRYAGASQVSSEGGKTTLALFGNVQRGDVRGAGRVKDPIRLREALSALHDVVSSDFRYIPKDRTQYMAYMRLRKQASTMNLWEAQRAYVDWLQRNDPLAFAVLDPIVTVHPDQVLFEVFSKDEGSYAKLGVDWSALEVEGERRYGSTNIDFSQALFDGIQRMRSYRETRLSVTPEAVAVATAGAPEVMEKKVSVPDSWLRGFLQVQSAGTLPRTVLTLAPLDLYNVLRHLRMNADVKTTPLAPGETRSKKGGRGVRVELVPGEAPRLVLEPWELVLPTTAGVYTGKTPEIVRIWGRRRLMLLKRLLPFAERVEVHLLGTGLPSFYVLRAGPITFTLALSGFTSANWAQAVSFDLLLPRKAAPAALDKVTAHLEKVSLATAAETQKALKLDASACLEALQVGCQQGKLMFDVEREVYRYRPLTGAPIDAARFEFRNDRERVAHDLVAQKGAVKIVTENRIHGVGLELTGKVAVAADKREYRPQLLVDDEGRVRKADCTCSFFRKHQLKEGPCEHLVALRLLQAREEAERRAQRGKARTTITVETRTYSKRHAKGESVVQLSFDERRLKVRWGERGEAGRAQSLVFDSVDEARAAYFERVTDLEKRGFLDATAG